MSKASKSQSQAMLGSTDGVTVIEEEGKYHVAFVYTDRLLGKIGALKNGDVGAVFDKDNKVWGVPLELGGELAAVVADMRDFVKNRGVQVKDRADGGKNVIFDFNPELNKIIGPIDGAAYDKEANAWKVPMNSKALVLEGTQVTNFLDLSIEKMRNYNMEVTNARDNIMKLAGESAVARGMTPGIHYPEKAHSYTGQILNANAHFAAQLTGKDDATGVAFIAIHNMADLGKTLFKGDAVRIDYDENKQVSNVRTSEVYEEQQKERAVLTLLAANKIDGANIRNASTKDTSKYNGEVVDVKNHFMLQHVGRAEFVIHPLGKLNEQSIQKGDQLAISYKNGIGAVTDLSKKKEAAQGMGR